MKTNRDVAILIVLRGIRHELHEIANELKKKNETFNIQKQRG